MLIAGYTAASVAVVVSERGSDGEKVGQEKGGGQPQLSASVNVLTAQLNISLCHDLFVSHNVCVHLFACVLKVLW